MCACIIFNSSGAFYMEDSGILFDLIDNLTLIDLVISGKGISPNAGRYDEKNMNAK